MTKDEQRNINELAVSAYINAMYDLDDKYGNWGIYAPNTRLRTCQAGVYETTHYYVLRSFEKYVAVIDKATNTLFDVHQLEYGYTAVSAQHISKFHTDYGSVHGECCIFRYVHV